MSEHKTGRVPDGYMPIPTAEQLADALDGVRCYHDLGAELIAPRLLANLLAVTSAKAGLPEPDFALDGGSQPCYYAETVQRIVAALSAQQSARQPELTVWEGPMPESNGKSNFTAVLMRKGADLFDGISGGMTIARSEYPDRVRYEADCVRWLIGELDNEPCIIDYDADKHSGYVAQQSAHVSVPRELVERIAGKGCDPDCCIAYWREQLRALLNGGEA